MARGRYLRPKARASVGVWRSVDGKEVTLMNVIEIKMELLRVEEAARMLQIGRTKMYELMGAGELPVVRIGRSVRIPRRSLEDWIAAHIESPFGRSA
jgi:excisionase family DNA binding protein